MNAPIVSIGAVSINQDTDGRYSLNDLHQASGGEPRHRPPLWLENQQTQDLIAELAKPLKEHDAGIPASPEISGLPAVVIIKGGKGKQGTFVVRELVYSYAMWISPAFHLKVIRTFDAVMTGNVSTTDTLIPSEQQLIHEAVDARVSALPETVKGKAKAEIWSRVHRKFRVAQYAQLPRTQIMDAILYITRMDLRCAPGQTITTAPPSPQITAADMRNLQRLAWQVTHPMIFEKAGLHAFWAALRLAADCPAPHRFEERHLPLLAVEVTRILEAVTAYYDNRRAMEEELCKRIIRGRAELAPFVAKLQADHAEWSNALHPWRGTLDSWHHKDIADLTHRTNKLGSDHRDCAEPVA